MTRNPNRLVYLDWMRGLAVILMLQGHVFDGWLQPQARSSEWFWLSQFLGGFPAPIFLFLVGVSLALMLDKMRAWGSSSLELARKVVRRGAWILLLAYAFRIEQFLVWYPASRWSDVFRVDTLNCIAVCTLVIGLFSIAFKTRRANIAAMGSTTAAFVLVTPLVYSFRDFPPLVLSYLNGDGHSASFSLFPWAAFAIAGMTFGYVLLEAKGRFGEKQFFRGVAVGGICTYAAGVTLSLSPIFEYGFFDYSLTSPHYFLVRLGWILLILYGAYLWSTRHEGPHRSAGECKPGSAQPQKKKRKRGSAQPAGTAQPRWSPIIVLGQRSLLVYWIHIELVYGKLFHGFYRSLELSATLKHLIWFIPLMVVVACARELQRLVPEIASRMLPMTAGSDSGK